MLTDISHYIGDSLFAELAAVLAMASLLGALAVKFHQPLIVAFILTGILTGPEVFGILGHADGSVVETLAQFGIAVLLFMVGLKLDLRIIRETGPVVLIAGGLQVALTFAAGFVIGLMLGHDTAACALIGLALAFSSTIIAVKLLSDQRAIDSLYGQIALGILIIQDIIVIIATIVIAGIMGETATDGFDIADFAMIVAKGGAMIAALILFIRYGAAPATRLMGRSPELMVVCCLSFAVIMAGMCQYIGFSKELGGLIAGIALASTSYNNVIAARLSALRDFLLLFFFVGLGAHISLSGLGGQIVPALLLSCFVLVGKPILIAGILVAMKFRKRTGFLTGIALSQISEFSLILIAMGYDAGLVDQATLSLITLVGLITMALSSYAILNSARLYAWLETNSTFAAMSASKTASRENYAAAGNHPGAAIVIFGLGRYGEAMAKRLISNGYDLLGVDFSPEAVARARKQGIIAIQGDAADPEFIAHLSLESTRVVIFAFHHYMTGPLIEDLRRTLAATLRQQGFRGRIAATSHHPDHDTDLPAHGIDIVLGPFEDAAEQGAIKIIGVIDPPAQKG